MESFLTLILRSLRIKKTIKGFKLGCSKAFYNRLPRILKGNKITKDNPKELLIIARKSGKILPKSVQKTFYKLAENKAASIQNWKVGKPFHLFLKKQKSAEKRRKAQKSAKSAGTKMHHYLSLFTLEFDAGAK